jgi:uncharacterized hydrophobic protein (TIGR00271 family)
MLFLLIFDPKLIKSVQQDITPVLSSLICETMPFPQALASDFDQKPKLLTFLSDQQLKQLLGKLQDKNPLFACLPHPEGQQTCLGLGIALSLLKAMDTFRQNHELTQGADILYCNEIPVFNHLAIGYTFQLADEPGKKNLSAWFTSLKALFTLKPFRLDVLNKHEKTTKTSVSGVVVAQHKNSTIFSRMVLQDAFANDGMMHIYLLSPRSILSITTFFVATIFGRKKLPAFTAHLKTDQLTLVLPKGCPQHFLLDGETNVLESIINLRVAKGQISVVPGKKELFTETPQIQKEVYHLKNLPLGEAALSLSSRKLPFFKHASTDEFKELFKVLREHARPRNEFLVLMALSVILATLGLFADSAQVVIGAMILAPLMAPIISLSMATLRQEKQLAIDSACTILAGLGIAYFFAVGIALITPIQLPNDEILSRTRPNLLDLGIAVVSGIAGAYGYAREEVAKTLAGVAIAVALVPPLAVSGIGLGWANWDIFSGAALLLLTNLAGMVLAAALSFLLLGYSPIKLAAKALIVPLVAVSLLSIPLGFGFQRIIQENTLIRRLEGWETEKVTLKDIQVQKLNPLTLSVKLVASDPLTKEDIDAIKYQIEEKLGQTTTLEVTTVLKR